MQWCLAQIVAMPRVVELRNDTYYKGSKHRLVMILCGLGIWNISLQCLNSKGNGTSFMKYRNPGYSQHLDSVRQLPVFPRIWSDVGHITA